MRKGLATLLLISALCVMWFETSVAAQSDWTAYWQKFKTAVVKSDKKTVLSLSSSASLPDAYQELFGSRARRNCFAKAKPVKGEQDGYSVFCGEQGYYFKQVDGQFKFVETFAND